VEDRVMGKYLDLDDVVAGNPVAQKELDQLRQQLENAETRLQGRTYCHSDQAVEDYVRRLEAKLAEVTTEKDEAIKNYKLAGLRVEQLDMQLATKERDTAEKCAELCKFPVDIERIAKQFNIWVLYS
jgi:chromosome segregation ATPase